MYICELESKLVEEGSVEGHVGDDLGDYYGGIRGI